jgi:Icc-related predicted phosphoesterase
MRLLAFSDIHHNLAAVRKLRALEKNSFDAIVVAGDIGSASANEFFQILATFKCPVLYVFGNWDHELSYRKVYDHNCHLIHGNMVEVGGIYFTGFSGCPTNWGKNPVARRVFKEMREANRAIIETYSATRKASLSVPRDRDSSQKDDRLKKIRNTKSYQRYIAELRFAKSTILRENRQSVIKAVRNASIDPRKCVVVTHERLARLGEELPGALLHLHGHIHQYSDRVYKGTRYIDVAVLDRPIPVRPRIRGNWTMEDCRNLNGGNYVIIEVTSSEVVSAQCVYMRRNYPGWVPLEDTRFIGRGWITEEKKWARTPETNPRITSAKFREIHA